MDVFAVVVTAVWAMLPAYIPNNVAVVGGGGPSIDGGRRWRGARLLGDGKTWRGTAVGIGTGIVVGLLLNAIHGWISPVFGVSLPTFTLAAIIALPTGAMLGDIMASFVKRRTGRSRGSAFPLVDQLDFVVLALLLAAVADPVWFGSVFTLPVIAAVLLLTPALHLGTNGIAYGLGLKDEPW